MKHAIITGGSSGIGLAVALELMLRGFHVSLIARGKEGLQSAARSIVDRTACAPDKIYWDAADVGDHSAIEKAIDRCEARFGPCDLLVASAGIVEPCTFLSASYDDLHGQIKTNLIGTINSIRAVYSGMVSRRSGKIMIISSGAALIGIHGYSAYCASKWALRGFAEALRVEAENHNVTIMISYPPDTLTRQYDGEIGKRTPQAKILMGQHKVADAEIVAGKLVASIEQGKSSTYFTPAIWCLAFFGTTINPWIHRWVQWKHRRLVKR